MTTTAENLPGMSIDQIVRFALHIFRVNMSLPYHRRHALFIHGSPGIAKTELLRLILAKIAAEYNCDPTHIDISLAHEEPTEISGINFPDLDKGFTRSLVPERFRKVDPDCFGLMTFDEWGQGTQMAQNACLSGIRGGRFGEWLMPHKMLVIAISNRLEDRAGIMEMGSAMALRFCHVSLDPTLAAWLEWARDDTQGRINPLLADWQEAFPQHFNQFDPDALVSCVPRQVETLSDLFAGMDDDYKAAACVGIVGQDTAASVLRFEDTYQQVIVTPAEVLADPTTCSIPEQRTAQYAMCESVLSHVQTLATDSQCSGLESALLFADRLTEENRIFLVRSCFKLSETLSAGLLSTDTAVSWCRENAALIADVMA